MRISPREWAVLFGDAPAKTKVDIASMQVALDRATTSQALPPARLEALREQMRSVSGAAHRTSAMLDVQLAAPKSSLELRVLRFLEDAKIPVRVSTENGSNFGHQTAATSAVRELRELGYTGPIELVVPRGAEQKMVQLLPGFDPELADQHIDAGLHIRCLLERDLDTKSAGPAIGIVAASDHDDVAFTDVLGVDACVVLQPYDWPGTRRLEIRGRPNKTLDLPEGSTFAFTVNDPLDGVDPFLPAQMEALGKVTQSPGILAILRGVVSGRLDLMPVYGVHTPAVKDARDTVIQNLTDGVREFQVRAGDDAKPTVVLEINPNTESTIEDVDLPTKLRTAKNDEVLVVSTGTVPRAVFELLYQQATLPSVLEGANASNLVQLMGTPFVSVYSTLTGLPALPGVEGVERVSEGLSRDEATTQVERLRTVMATFVGLGQQVPPEVLTPLAARIRAGEPLDDENQARMHADVRRAIHAARPNLAEEQVAGFATLIAESMAEMCSVLARISTLSDADRIAIADFDATAPDAGAEAERIFGACHAAIERLVVERFATFIEATRDPDSATSQYFVMAHENAHAEENRQLLRGLDRLRAALEGGGS